MADERRRLNLSFSMKSEEQKQAWELLSSLPQGRRTETVCRVLLEHRNCVDLLQAVRQVVREELKAYGGLPAEKPNTEEPRKAEVVRDDILGFLRELQGGDDD